MHEGRLVDSGAPKEVFSRPKSVDVARLVGDPPISIVPARMHAGKLDLAGGISIDVSALSLPPRPTYQLGVRPEKIHPGGKLHARVSLAEISGSETVVHLTLPFGDMVMLLPGVERFEPDDEIGVGFSAADIFFFDDAGALLLAPDNLRG